MGDPTIDPGLRDAALKPLSEKREELQHELARASERQQVAKLQADGLAKLDPAAAAFFNDKDPLLELDDVGLAKDDVARLQQQLAALDELQTAIKAL